MSLINIFIATCYAEETLPEESACLGLVIALPGWLWGSFPISFFLISLFLLLCFYFPPKVSFIVRASVAHLLQAPLICLLAYEFVSTSSVRHLESRKDCQMVSQTCLVLCLTTNGTDPVTGFSDVADTSS